MYTCERCGHQLEGNQERCAFCGARQQRDNAAGEKKKCKKCHRDIPVNANFCPYCGADQAYLDPNELHQEEAPGSQEKPQGDRPVRVTTIDNEEDLQRFLMAMQQQMQQQQQRVPHLPANESPRTRNYSLNEVNAPGHTFVLGKRMGRADFWWGTLGLVLLLTCYTLVIGLGVQLFVSWGLVKTLRFRWAFPLQWSGQRRP